MVYRLRLDLTVIPNLNRAIEASLGAVVPRILEEGLNIIAERARQNLSGVPFQSPTGTHTIYKRTGKAAASIQVQVPYGSPFRGRLFASAMAQYPGNEPVDYVAVLEFGRGEILPKNTPSMRAGRPQRARLTIPEGPQYLSHGVKGFRGVSGYYRFVNRIPPKEGMYPVQVAAEASRDLVFRAAFEQVDRALREAGL